MEMEAAAAAERLARVGPRDEEGQLRALLADFPALQSSAMRMARGL